MPTWTMVAESTRVFMKIFLAEGELGGIEAQEQELPNRRTNPVEVEFVDVLA